MFTAIKSSLSVIANVRLQCSLSRKTPCFEIWPSVFSYTLYNTDKMEIKGGLSPDKPFKTVCQILWGFFSSRYKLY